MYRPAPETTVRAHAPGHGSIGDLPLVTESARVTSATALDADRRPAVTAAINDALAADDRATLLRRVGTLAARYDRERPVLRTIEFRTDRDVDYLAGQYVGLRYDGTARAYSLSSSPARDVLEICVRRVPDGRLSPRLCGDLSVGDRLTVRGPYGDLVLEDPPSRDLVFLATGTGVAPFKGIIDALFDSGSEPDHQRDVWLFLGAAWADDLPYREAFRALADERDDFHFIACLSREPYLADWDGETAYLHHAFLKHVDPETVTAPVDRELAARIQSTPDSGLDRRIDPGDTDVYACGINAMVHGLVTAAERIGVPPARIRSEGFG